MNSKESNTNWQEHLDDLESLYHPDNFFDNQPYKPKNETNVREDFFHPTLMEETDIPEEGQLTVDIFQDEKNLYVVTPVAGAKVGDIEINLDNDVLTIRGEREKTFSGDDDQYIYKECYWGKFSRSVILPLPVQQNKVKAEFKNNVLKITLPKAEEARNIEIRVKNLDE